MRVGIISDGIYRANTANHMLGMHGGLRLALAERHTCTSTMLEACDNDSCLTGSQSKGR